MTNGILKFESLPERYSLEIQDVLRIWIFGPSKFTPTLCIANIEVGPSTKLFDLNTEENENSRAANKATITFLSHSGELFHAQLSGEDRIIEHGRPGIGQGQTPGRV